MKKKWIAGIAVSTLFVYLSVRNIDIKSVAEGFKSANYGYFFPILLCFFLIQVLRSYRWGLLLTPLLRPDEKIRQLDLFAVTSVGFLAVVAMPARLGELARSFLITGKSSVRMAAALGTVFVERIFDILAVLGIFFSVLYFVSMPPWLMNAGILFLAATFVVLTILLFIILKRAEALNFLTLLLQRLPKRFQHKLGELLHHFIDGIAILSDAKTIVYVVFLSLVIWMADVAAIYLLFVSYGFHLPLVAPFVLMVVLIIGIAIPTAPGFIGNWHYFCILGLSLFGVPKSDALSYAISLHVLSIGLIVLLGAIFIPFTGFSFADIKAKLASGNTE
jgi:glycosyltransferase 2 family protein